jgi:hypothetical protein
MDGREPRILKGESAQLFFYFQGLNIERRTSELYSRVREVKLRFPQENSIKHIKW